MTTTIKIVNPKVEYPSSDGEPLAETYLHLYAIITTLEVIKQYLNGKQATVLADQFLYYAQGFPRLRVAADVMVIFDVEPGGRDNYKIWEEGQVPQVVFEMTSKGTQKQDQEEKKNLYEQLGILEYWLFDPKGEWIEEKLRRYRLEGETYQLISDGITQPLGLRVMVEGELLRFYRLDTGDKLLIPTELAEQLQQERQRAERERQRADRLAEYLLEQGIDPDSLT
jgi:Uma2 family endonuclease